MSADEEQQDLTPPERLTYALQSTAELTEAFNAVEAALKTAEVTILGAKKRKEALRAELKVRQTEDHQKALAAFLCPKCGNQSLDQITHGLAAGYSWSRLDSVESMPAALSASDHENDYEERFYRLGEDGEAVPERKCIQVAACQECKHIWPWPENLKLEWN
jgi:hypothetical protein